MEYIVGPIVAIAFVFLIALVLIPVCLLYRMWRKSKTITHGPMFTEYSLRRPLPPPGIDVADGSVETFSRTADGGWYWRKGKNGERFPGHPNLILRRGFPDQSNAEEKK